MQWLCNIFTCNKYFSYYYKVLKSNLVLNRLMGIDNKRIVIPVHKPSSESGDTAESCTYSNVSAALDWSNNVRPHLLTTGPTGEQEGSESASTAGLLRRCIHRKGWLADSCQQKTTSCAIGVLVLIIFFVGIR